MTARNGLYRGYSSFEFESIGSFKINDVELIKLDLLNHIFTRRGERVMMPRFGTIIPDLVFEPLDPETIDQVDSELRTVFDYDPRVELLDLNIVTNGNTITAGCLIRCVELDVTELMNLNIEFEGADAQ
jgi:phage baseplate assembly protein W